MNTTMRRAVYAGLGTLLFAAAACAQQKSVNPGINDSYVDPDIDKYIGRFEREGRDAYDNRHAIVKACGIKPGMTVADVGAGTGLFTRLFSPLAGPEGKVYAVDISEEFVEHVKKTAKQAGMANVAGVVCSQDSAPLPPGSVDLVFICDAYHHFEFPHKTMLSLRRSMKPGATLVLVDYRRIEGESDQWVLGHVRAGQEVFTREIEQAGFRQVEERKDLLKNSYFVKFVKVDR